MLNKLVDSNANNPGELWKALNAIKKRDNKDPSSNIIQREWFYYFKKLISRYFLPPPPLSSEMVVPLDIDKTLI